jgi:hypothetical protein
MKRRQATQVRRDQAVEGRQFTGLSLLAASGLGDPLEKTFTYDAADYCKSDDDMSG